MGKVTQGTGSGQSPPAVVWDGWEWLQDMGWDVQPLCTNGDHRGCHTSAITHTMHRPLLLSPCAGETLGCGGSFFTPSPIWGTPFPTASLSVAKILPHIHPLIDFPTELGFTGDPQTPSSQLPLSPRQMTPASSWWPQLCCPQPRWKQSARRASPPPQPTLSSSTGPLP